VRRLLQTDSPVHAVLFYGAAGAGKTELSMALAQAWLCTQPGPEGACGACASCGSFARGNHPDLLEVRPAGPSAIIPVKAITPTPDLKPEDPQPISIFFRTTPLAGRHKLVLIHDAHRLNDPAAHSLLKMLEEPPPFARLLLSTPSVGSLPSTIRSRCLAVACELPDETALDRAWPDAGADLRRLSEGSPGRLREMTRAPEPFAAIAEFARELPRRTPAEAIVVAERFRALAEGLAAPGGLSARAANAEALDLLARCLARSPGTDPRWTHATLEAHRRILGNGNPALVFDALFAEMLLT
jgi:DNA polymerase III subunit delta'